MNQICFNGHERQKGHKKSQTDILSNNDEHGSSVIYIHMQVHNF